MVMFLKTRQRRRESGLLDDIVRCSRCDQPNQRAGQRYCAACHAVYMKEWRRKPVVLSHETRSFTSLEIILMSYKACIVLDLAKRNDGYLIEQLDPALEELRDAGLVFTRPAGDGYVIARAIIAPRRARHGGSRFAAERARDSEARA